MFQPYANADPRRTELRRLTGAAGPWEAAPTVDAAREQDRESTAADPRAASVESPSGELGPADADLASLAARGLGVQGSASRSLHRLQRSHGNAAVARAIRSARRPAVRTLARFEAPVHEAAERQGLTSDAGGRLAAGALTNEEASAVYIGNWMRDLNQVFVPLVRRFLPNEVVFSMLAYMGAKKFGRAFTSEQFGYYIPAEHIDSPAGLTWEDDLLPGPPPVPGEPVVPGAQARPAPYVTPQERPDPSSTAAGASLFSVDQTGTMAYIRRTNEHIERRLELAARRGRNPDGMMHFGAALHAIEDLFAHSNWIEMAVNRVLSSNVDLLPSLRGDDRTVFTYSAEQEVRPGVRRPVLMTGSFTGADTKISLSSEVVKFMSEPLPAPSTPAEALVEERFMGTLLRSFQAQLANNAGFRSGVEGVLRSNGVPGVLVGPIMKLPFAEIYDLTRIHWIPDWVKNNVIIPMKTFMREGVSTWVLQPAARSMQAEGINAQVADTSLINFLREQQATATRTAAQLSPAERRVLEQTGRFTGESIDQQVAAAQAAAGRHVTSLQATPERVIAGPTHSQISKDHPNSPFYALAFHVATEADRRMRERMVAAWNEQAGGATTPFDFTNFPATAGVPAGEAQAAEANRRLYQDTRTTRATKETESLERGNRVVAQGGDVHAAAGRTPPPFTPYDVAAMRRDNAAQIRAAAQGLRGIVGAPGQAASAAQRLRDLIGLLDVQRERLQRAQELLGQAAAAGQAASSGPDAAALRRLADELDGEADAVEAARTHALRAGANNALRATREKVLNELRNKTLDAQRALAASTLVIIDQQIADTAPAYTIEQREVIEGRRDLPEHTGAPAPLAASTITMRDAALTLDPAWQGGRRGPALRALIEESRLLLNHPYESTWWVALVTDHIRRFPDQTMADIEARNAGYATFRRPGEAREGH
jgi:hypothetical protein